MSRHAHPDPDKLTFACAACIERVQKDQQRAWNDEIDKHPERFSMADRLKRAAELSAEADDLRYQAVDHRLTANDLDEEADDLDKRADELKRERVTTA